jgi:hypothetical protein
VFIRRKTASVFIATLLVALTMLAGAYFVGNVAPSKTPQNETVTGFSIFWITDTQHLSSRFPSGPQDFNALTDWIVNNGPRYSLKMVIHTGDIVDDGNVATEWENANASMSALLSAGIPYAWCAGNHDDLTFATPDSGWIGRNYAAFNASVVSRAEPASWVGSTHQGMDTAVRLSADGLDLLILSIEFDGDPTVLQWAGNLLSDSTYSSYHVIIATHAYINATGSVGDPSWGQSLRAFAAGLAAIMNEHPNVFLTLNGHFHTPTGWHQQVGSRYELMFDRQEEENGLGAAAVTILNFKASSDQLEVTTYDVGGATFLAGPNSNFSLSPLFPGHPTSTSSGVATANFESLWTTLASTPFLVRSGGVLPMCPVTQPLIEAPNLSRYSERAYSVPQ